MKLQNGIRLMGFNSVKIWLRAIHKKFSVIFDPLTPPPPPTFGWPPPLPVRADTNFEYDTKISAKIWLKIFISSTPSPKQTPRKWNYKVRYLLTTLIQEKNRERITIHLKISNGNTKKIAFALRNLYIVLYEYINALSWP